MALVFLIGHHLQDWAWWPPLIHPIFAQMVPLAIFMLMAEYDSCKTLSWDQSEREGDLHSMYHFLNPSSAVPA